MLIRMVQMLTGHFAHIAQQILQRKFTYRRLQLEYIQHSMAISHSSYVNPLWRHDRICDWTANFMYGQDTGCTQQTQYLAPNGFCTEWFFVWFVVVRRWSERRVRWRTPISLCIFARQLILLVCGVHWKRKSSVYHLFITFDCCFFSRLTVAHAIDSTSFIFHLKMTIR